MSLSAAAAYGAADFFGGFATKRASIFAVTIFSQGTGLVLLLLAMPFLPGSAGAGDYLWGIAAGACGGAGIALLYHALAIGKMGVVSPITAVLAAAVPVIASVVRGDRPGGTQLAGIAVAIVAIAMISFSTEDDGKRELSTAGVREAVLSGIMIGGYYLFIAHAGRGAGLHPLAASRVASIVLLLGLSAIRRAPLIPPREVRTPIVVSGAIDMAANVLYVLATFAGSLSIAAVLTSLYPASTVFLARIVLKERLQRSQAYGALLALVGVALIAWRPGT